MVDGALNFQTQAAAQTMQAFINDEQTVSATQTGKLDNQTVQIETGEVDPSTKDDECMSSFMAQKQTKKAQHKKVSATAENRSTAFGRPPMPKR